VKRKDIYYWFNIYKFPYSYFKRILLRSLIMSGIVIINFNYIVSLPDRSSVLTFEFSV
jgi:hypothetical protein